MNELRLKVQNLFPLSLNQQNIWALEQACPGTSINNICTTLRIRGRVDLAVLQQSIDLVLSADSSLRTRITLEAGLPVQYQADFVQKTFPIYDFTNTDSRGVEHWEAAITGEPLPLLDAPLYRFILFRTGEHECGLIMKLHHIISDGWTQMLLCNRVGQTYLALLDGEHPELEISPSYEEYVKQETGYLASSAYVRDEKYWAGVLEQTGEPSALKSIKSAAVSPVGRRKSFDLPQIINNGIYSFCVKNRTSPFTAFYLALAIYFKRIGGEDRFTIGVPIFNRTNHSFKQTSGMFVSTLPFFNELRGDWTLTQCSEHLNEKWLEMLRCQRFPFPHIQRLAGLTQGGGGRLFNIALSYQNGQMLAGKDASVSFSGRWHYSGYQLEQLCIHLSNLSDSRRYSVDYDYLSQIFCEQEIDDLHACLMNILYEVLAAPDKPISQLSLLGAQEREQVLYDFNRTETPLYGADLYGRFSAAVMQHPSRTAVIYRGERTSYRQVEELSGRVQAALGLTCASNQELLAAILLPRSTGLLAAMMGVLRAGAAFVILPPELPVKRIEEILRQSGSAVLISDTATISRSGLNNVELPFVEINALPVQPAPDPAEADDSALAYVVYTSGSTGVPKGVEISRQSLLNLAQAMEPVYCKGAVLSLCSVGFDAFLLESAVALLNGRTVILPEDTDLESPKRLAELMLSYGAGFLATTPSRLSALMKHSEFCSALRRMESLVCGGENFPSDLLYQLQQITSARIYNQYGPSETTVGVSLKQLNGSAAITAGAPMSNCRLYVLDEWMNPLPVGVYGNLFIGGLCVGRGYRNAPELTEACFIASPFELGDRLYKSGDTASWTADGEIVLAGRTDQQVKLRGLRVEPQEVSSCLCVHPQVIKAAAVALNQNGQTVLAAYYTSSAPIPDDELRSFASSYLPQYMMPAVIMRVDDIPLTPNGKVDENRLPAPVFSAADSSEAATELAETVLEIFRKVLNCPELGADSDYFLFGGSSLNAMETIACIGEQTGFFLRFADLYTCRTARRVAALFSNSDKTEPKQPRLQKTPEQERYPLSPIQQGIYVQSHMDPTGLAYNMPGAFLLGAAPDLQRLQTALNRLVAEEPLLRAAFIQEADGVWIKVAGNANLHLSNLPGGGEFSAACAAFLKPFDLSTAPLLRAGIWEASPGSWVLFLDCHHIIGDGLTTPILLSRLDALYHGREPEGNGLSYLDYASQLGASSAVESDYWRTHLSPLPEPLDIPGDFPRTKGLDYKGGIHSLILSDELSDACDKFCRQRGVSAYMLFLGVFGVLLSRLSGKEEMVIGAPAAGRLMPETRTMCGPFINTLPLSLKPGDGKSVQKYLEEVREAVNGMLDHQRIGLEELISALGLKRTLSQSPLFQVIFSQRPLDAGAFELIGAPLEYLPIPTGTAKMELSVELFREKDHYAFLMEYSTRLFLPETAAYYCRCFEEITRDMISAADLTLGELNALNASDRMELLEIPRHTVSPFVNLPYTVMFAHHLALAPDEPAVIFHGVPTSRAQLDRRSNQLANLLADSGARPGNKIGIAMSRSMDLVAAVLAIWKTGCAYVPLLADYPAERLRYMTDIAEVSHILCDESASKRLPDSLSCTILTAENAGRDVFKAVPLSENDLAEVLFTSGSTGQPKGVMLKWRSIANMFAGFHQILKRVDGPILCTTNVVFDMFNGEVTMPLAMGKTIVMADDEEMMLPWKLAQLIERDGVRVTQSTPSRVQMWLSNEAFRAAARNLGMMIYGGEVLTEHLLMQAQTAAQDALMINMYGPTEGTVYNTTTEADYRRYTNIGWPMVNNRLYILDDKCRPVLPTACGDLYLAGECVTAGYIDRPDLTESAFLPDPFFPGERMYRTGDIARLRLDGSYDFHGRRDAQVKLNGQRVELSEINETMVAKGCALQAATVPVRGDDGSMTLHMFYVPVQGNAMEDSQIRTRLGETLPAYMIPSYLMSMDKLPYTPTGKLDLRALDELAHNKSNTENVPYSQTVADTPSPPAEQTPAMSIPSPEAAHDTLEWVLSIWGTVLGTTGLDPDRSFFEQGGTSLAALSVLSHYHNRKYELSLAQFYSHPTARGQAALLNKKEDTERLRLTLSAVPVKALSRYSRNTPPPPIMSDRIPRTALITGATGFLGAHLLRSLLDAGSETVYCLMRDGSESRLNNYLSWYFGRGWGIRKRGQIKVLRGDITQSGLALSRADYQALSGRLDAIYHCAADVRHYAADVSAFMRTNVTGTKNMIRLALDSRAELHHMSTTSVSGSRVPGGATAIFTERDFDLGQDWHSNLYIRSKFLAESAVIEAANAGLNARIYRLGRLVGRMNDGTFQRNPQSNAFWLLMRGVHALGAIPESMAGAPVEMTPIDWCADAIVALHAAPLSVCHIVNPEPPAMEQTARAVAPDLSVLPDEEWQAMLERLPTDANGDMIAPLMDYLVQLKAGPSSVLVDSRLTAEQLKTVGFNPKIPGPERLLQTFEFPAIERIQWRES